MLKLTILLLSMWYINTSNPGKLKEFQTLFAKQGQELSATHFDLPEIDSDPISVVVHKASQLDELIIVEDTSLDVEGADVGVNVRWLIDNLDQFAGKKASWKVLLAYRKGDKVYVYQGEIKGTIVHPRGKEGFGFDPVFLPDNATQTLAQSKPDSVNARALAVEALLQNNVLQIEQPIYHWDGPWQ